MTITLNHTIVSARDKDAAARSFAEIFGLRFEGLDGHFAPVRVNDTLTLDFNDAKGTSPALCVSRKRRRIRRDPAAGQGRWARLRKRALEP
jgi:hypothetical protein